MVLCSFSRFSAGFSGFRVYLRYLISRLSDGYYISTSNANKDMSNVFEAVKQFAKVPFEYKTVTKHNLNNDPDERRLLGERKRVKLFWNISPKNKYKLIIHT